MSSHFLQLLAEARLQSGPCWVSKTQMETQGLIDLRNERTEFKVNIEAGKRERKS